MFIEDLDEVKGNLIELGEEKKKGMNNLVLKLIEVIPSLHREYEALKVQVEEAAIVGVTSPISVFVRLVLKLLHHMSFVDKGMSKTLKLFYGKWMLLLSM